MWCPLEVEAEEAEEAEEAVEGVEAVEGAIWDRPSHCKWHSTQVKRCQPGPLCTTCSLQWADHLKTSRCLN